MFKKVYKKLHIVIIWEEKIFNIIPIRFIFFSPEEATSQNVNYMVCSGFTRNVYRELLNITIPMYTTTLLSYSRENVGNPEVVRASVGDGVFLVECLVGREGGSGARLVDVVAADGCAVGAGDVEAGNVNAA